VLKEKTNMLDVLDGTDRADYEDVIDTVRALMKGINSTEA
jgi:hypothetical protein